MRKTVTRTVLPLAVFGAVALGSATGIASALEPLPKGCDSEVLDTGASGVCVLWVQHYLDQYQGGKLTPDGKYGPETKATVKGFQTSRGLTSDGIVGHNTWMQMLGRINPR